MSKAGRPKGLYRPETHTYVGKFGINKEGFLSRLVQKDDGCLVWSGGTHKQGFGMYNIYNTELNKRQMQVTHRIAMMLHLGRELGRDDFVIHEFCDNNLCCNPDHMIVGTAHDRNRVQYAKGRRPIKKDQPPKKQQKRNYKWTEEEMRFMRNSTNEEIAARFGMTTSTASYMRNYFKNGYKWLD